MPSTPERRSWAVRPMPPTRAHLRPAAGGLEVERRRCVVPLHVGEVHLHVRQVRHTHDRCGQPPSNCTARKQGTTTAAWQQSLRSVATNKVVPHVTSAPGASSFHPAREASLCSAQQPVLYPSRDPRSRCAELTVLFRTPLTSNMTLTSASLLPSHSCKARDMQKRKVMLDHLNALNSQLHRGCSVKRNQLVHGAWQPAAARPKSTHACALSPPHHAAALCAPTCLYTSGPTSSSSSDLVRYLDSERGGHATSTSSE